MLFRSGGGGAAAVLVPDLVQDHDGSRRRRVRAGEYRTDALTSFANFGAFLVILDSPLNPVVRTMFA